MYSSRKKAVTPMLKTIIILLVVIFIFLTYVIILSLDVINLNDKKLNSQIFINQVFNDCFSDNFGVINKNDFTQNRLNNCFNNNYNNLLVKLSIPNLNSIYFGNKDDFNSKSQLCNLYKSNIECYKLIYPILLNIGQNKEISSTLTLYIISE